MTEALHTANVDALGHLVAIRDAIAEDGPEIIEHAGAFPALHAHKSLATDFVLVMRAYFDRFNQAINDLDPNAVAATLDRVESAEPDASSSPPPPADVELAAIEDVELARQIVLQRLAAIALGKAGVTIQAFQRVTQLAVLQTDDETTMEEKRDAQLEAEQFAERAAGAGPYELARQLKAAKVATLVTIEQLRAYDCFEGWPA